jgi:hypothetical protein
VFKKYNMLLKENNYTINLFLKNQLQYKKYIYVIKINTYNYIYYFLKYTLNFFFKKINLNLFNFSRYLTTYKFNNFIKNFKNINKKLIFFLKRINKFFKKKKLFFSKIFIFYFLKNIFRLNNSNQHSNFNLKKKYLKKKKINLKVNLNKYYYFINNYITSFFEFFLKKKIFLKFKKIKRHFLTFKLKFFFNYVLKSLKRYKFLLKKNFFFKDFLEIFSIFLKYKEIDLLTNWIRFSFERFTMMQQKNFLRFIKKFFKKFFNKIKKKYNIFGIYCSIKGKVCVKGNAKSRKYFFKSGIYSRTQKNLKYLYKHELIRTPTGVLGLRFILVFI